MQGLFGVVAALSREKQSTRVGRFGQRVSSAALALFQEIAATALYNILFDIAARTAKFEEGMTRVDRRLEGMQRSAGKIGQSLKNLFVVGGIAAFVREAAAAGDEMLTLAERTGRSVESLSQLDYVARRGNTSLDSLIKAQDKLAKGMGAIDDEGKAVVKVLDELGLSANRIRSLSPDQQLDAIAEAMGGVTDPTDRARIAMILFGKAGTELLPMLTSGAQGIRELREESDRLGATMSDLEARRLAKLDDQLEATAAQFRKLKIEIGGVLAQPIGSYFELLQKGLVGWRVALSLSGDEIEEINEKITSLRMEQSRLQEIERQWGSIPGTRDRLQQIREEMALLAERQDFLLRAPQIMARYEADVAAARAKSAAVAEAAAKKIEDEAKAAEKAAEAYAKWRAEMAAIIEQERFLNELGADFHLPPIMDTAEFDDSGRELTRMLEEQAEESAQVFEDLYAGVAEEFKDTMGEMSVYAEQAARNIQSHLADFLFDPFDKGIKGMLRGFIDVLRRMVAEAASARILESLGLGGSGGGWLGSLFGSLFGAGGSAGSSGGGSFRGLAAHGLTLKPGEFAIAGEAGPEPVFGGSHGATIIPFPKASQASQAGPQIHLTVAPVTNVDARGATTDLLKQLPAILEAHAQRTVKMAEAKVVEGLRISRYSLG